ncbi:MAG: GntR family transcriptional regulator, partial [Chitinivibrionales bacterium]|nr:GntR family transcriptional regulator [Chitinivibrionales bacterium]
MRRQTAEQVAEQFVRWAVSEHVRIGRHRLPTVADLAQRAGVGLVAMSRAVRRLAAEGLIEARPGKGITLPPTREATQFPRTRAARWEEASEALADAILRGEFAPGSQLPSVKELTARFGVSYPSLRAALRSLAQRRVIVRHRRGYRVADLVGRRAGSTIGLIAGGISPRDFVVHFPRSAQVLRTIEEQCMRSNVALLPVSIDRLLHNAEGGGVEATGLSEALGYLILTMQMSREDFGAAYTCLGPQNRPLSVLDEGINVALPPGAGRRVRLIRFADTRRDAENVATFLLQLGHRRIAYVSPTHGARWSRERLAGLRSVYEAAGLPTGVEAVTYDKIDSVSRGLSENESPRELADRAERALRRSDNPGLAMIGAMIGRMKDSVMFMMEPEILAEIEAKLFARACELP